MAQFPARLLVAVIGGLLLATASVAADKIVGATWVLQIAGPKGKPVELKMRATLDGKIFIGGKEAGTHKSKGDDIEMTITGKGDSFNGSYKLTKLKTDATAYTGRLTNEKGKEVEATLQLRKD